MTKPQYGEPWRWAEEGDDYWSLDNNEGGSILTATSDRDGSLSLDVFKADADRIVACVNALAGREPEAVKQQLEQRDELLEAAKEVWRKYLDPPVEILGETYFKPSMIRLNNAIAKAGGGAC